MGKEESDFASDFAQEVQEGFPGETEIGLDG